MPVVAQVKTLALNLTCRLLPLGGLMDMHREKVGIVSGRLSWLGIEALFQWSHHW